MKNPDCKIIGYVRGSKKIIDEREFKLLKHKLISII